MNKQLEIDRLGKFTSSNIHRLMTCEEKENLSSGAITYIEDIVSERLTGIKNESPVTLEMKRGILKEADAIFAFEVETGVVVENSGESQKFFEYNDFFGGTPDGLVKINGEYYVVEVKCPNSVTHLRYITTIKDAKSLKKVKKEYFWQLQGNMLSTGLKKSFFISFDDRFINSKQRLKYIEIERDEDAIKLIKKRIKMAEEEIKKITDQLI